MEVFNIIRELGIYLSPIILILLIVLTYFGRKIFDSMLANSIEIKTLEHNIKYSSLHIKRSEIIHNLYEKVVLLNGAMLELTAQIKEVKEDFTKEEKERLIKVDELLRDFVHYYLCNKIYFSKISCEIIDELRKAYWDNAWDYSSVQRLKDVGFNDEKLDKYYDLAKKAGEATRKEIPKILVTLENEFRELLGVEI